MCNKRCTFRSCSLSFKFFCVLARSAAGAVVGTRSYDAFGRILGESGAVDRFAFQGREWDAGAGLYQFRARWYDPVTRQFTSADPLGFAAGDWNTRRFVANNPLSGTDPTGMALADYVKLSATGALVGAAIGGYCGAIGAAIAAAADGQGWRVVLVQAGRGFIVGVILGAVAGSNPYGAVAVGAYGAGVLTVHPPRTTGDFVGLAVGFACGTVAGPRLSRWANGGAPKPGVKPPPEPEVAPPKGGCFVAGTLVLAEAVVLDADAAATPGLAEVIGDWLGTDDGRWAVAALLLAGLASRHVGGRRAGTPKPARGDDESEWIEDGGEGADEFGRWHWKR